MVGLCVLSLMSLSTGGCVGRVPPPTSGPHRSLTLAKSAWPCSGHDAQHTHRSDAIGPSKPARKWVATGFFDPDPTITTSGLLLMSPDAGGLVGIAPANGYVTWTPSRNDELRNATGTPAQLSDGRLIVTGEEVGWLGSKTYVAAVDVRGRTLWRTNLGEPKYGMIEPEDLSISNPTIGPDGTIYATALPPNALYALDPNDGHVLWTRPTAPGPSDVAVAPNGTVYVAGFTAGDTTALDPKGRRLWTAKGDGGPLSLSVGSNGTLYVLGGRTLNAFAPDGTRQWTASVEAGGDIGIGPDGTLYVIGDGLYAISRYGRQLWRAPVGGDSRLAVDGAGTVYLQNGLDDLCAVSSSGSVKWRYKVGSLTTGAPAIGADGTIYCFDGYGDSGGMVAVGSPRSK